MRTLFLTTAAAAIAGLAMADTPSINPGQWETTTTTSVALDMNGQAMNMPGQTMTSSDCVTEEEAEFTPEDFAQDGCTVSNFQSTATTASFDLACSQNGVEMAGSMAVEADSDGNGYSGSFDIAGNAPGMGDMKVNGVVTGKRTGTCS